MARPCIASLFLVNSDCFLFLLILTKFCTRATAGGAAIFKLNAAICKAMWLTHTHTKLRTVDGAMHFGRQKIHRAIHPEDRMHARTHTQTGGFHDFPLPGLVLDGTSSMIWYSMHLIQDIIDAELTPLCIACNLRTHTHTYIYIYVWMYVCR